MYTLILRLAGTAMVAASATAGVFPNPALVVDPLVVERLDNATLRAGVPVSRGTAFAFDKPWEGPFCGYMTLIDDDGLYRMYYRGLPAAGKDGSDAEVTCYAESKDGVTWTKPALGLYQSNNGQESNIILKDRAPFSHNFAPFLDRNPNARSSHRFKALAGTHSAGLHAFASEDGIRWEMMQKDPVITEGAFDSQNVAFWSEKEQQYVCYLRTWTEGPFGGFRTISRSTSDDFVTWTEPVEMTYGAPLRDHLYTNQTTPYFRDRSLFIALAARFMPGRRALTEAQAESIGVNPKYAGDCSDVILLTTRGGNAYHRPFAEAFMRPGPGLENWTSRTNYPARGIVQSGPHEMSFYVQRGYGQPGHYVERMALRIDGFASVHAGATPGEMLTKAMPTRGGTLSLNAGTSAAGSIKVQVETADGRAIEGYTFDECVPWIGDGIALPVQWNDANALPELADEEMRLRIRLVEADLYSFSVE